MKKLTLFFMMLAVSICVSAQSDTTKAAPFKVMLNGQEEGPFGLKQLKQMVSEGQLNRNTMVMQEGMTSWSEAEQIPEINELFKLMPSAQVQSSDTVKVATGKKVKVKNAYYYSKKSRIHGAIGATLFSATLLGTITWVVGEKSETNNIIGYVVGGLFAVGTVEIIVALLLRSKAKKLSILEKKVSLSPASSGIGFAINF
jgi:hypothetical protein